MVGEGVTYWGSYDVFKCCKECWNGKGPEHLMNSKQMMHREQTGWTLTALFSTGRDYVPYQTTKGLEVYGE